MRTTFVQGLFMVDSLLLELEVIVSLLSKSLPVAPFVARVTVTW